MGRRLRSVGLACGCAWVAVACTSISGLSNGGGDGGAGDAAGTADAPTDALADGGSSTDAPGDAPGESGTSNLVPNPSFEEPGGGCGSGWTSYGAIVQRSSVARSGSSSCELCANPSDTAAMQLTTTGSFPVKAGSYSTEAWLMASPGKTPTGNAGVQVFFTPADGGAGSVFQASFVTPNATWTPSNNAFQIPGDGTIQVGVHVYEPQGGCVLVDDVGLYPP
jgi:hypothetical protein